jgi:hypothetical protein
MADRAGCRGTVECLVSRLISYVITAVKLYLLIANSNGWGLADHQEGEIRTLRKGADFSYILRGCRTLRLKGIFAERVARFL